MIFYFSGTGNSQLVAIQLAEALGQDLVSVNRCLKRGETGCFHSEEPLIFVAPTYSWRIPQVLETWIRENSFEGNRNAYFVLTCAGSAGNAGAYIQQLCTKKGFAFRGLASVLMPENYLALGPTPRAQECEAIIEKSREVVADLAVQIQQGRCFVQPQIAWADKLKSGPVNPLFYAILVHDKGFVALDACTSCEKCARRCSLNNIELREGRHFWKGKCTHCMACIGGCPAKAIEYKKISQGRHRHYVMNDALCWGN